MTCVELLTQHESAMWALTAFLVLLGIGVREIVYGRKKRIAMLEKACLDFNSIAECTKEDCEHCAEALMRTQPVINEILEKERKNGSGSV